MRTLRSMVVKDLRRKVRSPLGIGVVLSFPILFSLMLAVSFGTGGDDPPRIHLLVENRDDNFVGGMLMSSLTSDQVAENFDVEVVGEEGAARMERGEASALLRIPEGFTDDVLNARPATLELVRNPAQGILPEIAEQLAGVLIAVLDSGARVLGEPLGQIATAMEDETDTLTEAMVTTMALSAWRTMNGAGTFVIPPVITFETESLGSQGTDADSGPGGFGSIFLAILPGISVYALFLVGDLAMRDILTESAAGTLRRQLSGPIGAGTVIVGKALYTVVLCSISLVMLTVVGLLVSGGRVDIAGFVLLSSSLVLAVTGMAAALYGLASDERRGSTVGAILYMVLAFAGGSFVQLESLPASVRAISPLSPFYWGTLGYRTLLRDGGGLPDLLTNIAVLAGVGIVCLGIGALLLRRRLLRGALA